MFSCDAFSLSLHINFVQWCHRNSDAGKPRHIATAARASAHEANALHTTQEPATVGAGIKAWRAAASVFKKSTAHSRGPYLSLELLKSQ